MRSVEEIIAEIEQRIASEKSEIAELRADGDLNTTGGGMSLGSLDTLKLLKEFIFSEPESKE